MGNAIMNEATFFMKWELIKTMLAKYEALENPQLSLPDGTAFYLDIIDEETRVNFKVINGETAIFYHMRNIVGLYKDEDAAISATFDKDVNLSTINPGRVEENAARTTLLVMAKFATVLVNEFDSDHFQGFDPESEGILIKLKEDNLRFIRVTGMNRPNLLGHNIFGDETMVRPYNDENMDELFGSGLFENDMDDVLELADEGDERSMLIVANAFYNDGDIKKAVKWYKKLDKINNATAEYNLGIIFYMGELGEKDYEKAVYYMTRADEHGEIDADRVLDAWEKIANGIFDDFGGDDDDDDDDVDFGDDDDEFGDDDDDDDDFGDVFGEREYDEDGNIIPCIPFDAFEIEEFRIEKGLNPSGPTADKLIRMCADKGDEEAIELLPLLEALLKIGVTFGQFGPEIPEDLF